MNNPYYLIIIGYVLSLIITYYGENENMKYIGIIVALITVAGALAVNFFQGKKDGEKLSRIKGDTEDIKPKVLHIKEVTKETDNVTKDIKHIVETVLDNTLEIKNGDIKKNISLIADEIRYQKRLELAYTNVVSREHIIHNVDKLFEDNAKEKLRNKKLAEENANLNFMLSQEKEYIISLEREIDELKKELRSYKQDMEIEM